MITTLGEALERSSPKAFQVLNFKVVTSKYFDLCKRFDGKRIPGRAKKQLRRHIKSERQFFGVSARKIDIGGEPVDIKTELTFSSIQEEES